MTNYLNRVSQKQLRVMRAVGEQADRYKLPAYIVGGVVRDILLKKKNRDLDICVEGNAGVLAKACAKKWGASLKIYQQFGTASVCFSRPRSMRVDFASTRKEQYIRPGALPVVRPGNIREDLFRRDFSINAMAISINAGNFGGLMDEFKGRDD